MKLKQITKYIQVFGIILLLGLSKEAFSQQFVVLNYAGQVSVGGQSKASFTLQQSGCTQTFIAYCVAPNANGGTNASTYTWNGSQFIPPDPVNQQILEPYEPIPSCHSCNITVYANSSPSLINIGSSSTLSAFASGGSGNYTYSWSNGLGNGTSKTVSPTTTTTTYTVTVTDNITGCVSSASTTVTANLTGCSALLASASSNPSSINHGGSSTLTASASGGSGNYSYVWNNGIGSGAVKIVSPSASSTYTVTVTDNTTGCNATASTSVGLPNGGCTHSIIASSNPTTINPGDPATLTASAVGGSGNYTYAWSDGLGLGTTKTVNPTSTHHYTIAVTDNVTGCVETAVVTVNVSGGGGGTPTNPPGCNFYATLVGNTSGPGGGSTSINTTSGTTVYLNSYGVNGSGSYTYSWNTGATTQFTSTVVTSSSTYVVTITDNSSGCIAIGWLPVTVTNPPCAPNITDGGSIAMDESNCNNYTPATITEVTPASGGSGTLEYIWEYSIDRGESWILISGTTSSTYQPPISISSTTLYRRGARRSSCIDYVYSNVVTKSIQVLPDLNNFTRIISNTPQSSGYFGQSVAVSNDYLVIGAYRENAGANHSGAVYIYKKNNSGNWGFEKKLISPNIKSNEEFGKSVAIDGDDIVVGAPNGAGAQVCANWWSGSGVAYVFNRNQGGTDNWGFVQKLDPLYCQNSANNFGATIDISGNYIAVGAQNDYKDNTQNNRYIGAVYIFRKNTNGTWSKIKKITSANGAASQASNAFGANLDLEGDNLIVGARTEGGSPFPGAAYLYNRNTGGTDNWGEAQYFTSPQPYPSQYYGYGVSITDDKLAIFGNGRAYLYENTGSTWALFKTIEGVKPQTFSKTNSDELIVTYQKQVNSTWKYYVALLAKDAGGPNAWGEVGMISKYSYDFGFATAFNDGVLAIPAPRDTVISGGQNLTAGAVYLLNYYTIIKDTICQGETYTLSSETFNSAGTYYITVYDENGCENLIKLELAERSITNLTDGGTIATDESNCGNYDPANITEITAVSGGSGGVIEYIWEQSIDDGVTWTTITGATGTTYDPLTITQTTKYRRIAKASQCTNYVYSNIVTKTVNPLSSCCTANTEFGTLTGSANIQNGYIQLTPNTGGQYGDAFSTNTANLSQDFNIISKIYLGDDDNGADGLRFTFRKNTNDIMFDFDTYQNGAELANDHFTLFTTTNGAISSDFDLNNIEDGVWHDMIVDWNATTQTITVTFDGNVIYTITRDIVNLDLGGDPVVYFGFQAWTGGAYNEQAACVSSVTYTSCSAGTTVPTLSATSICEPADLNSLVTSSTPSGATLVWFTNNNHTGTAYATPTTASTGTYYAFYYDATNNCYSPVSAAVTVNPLPVITTQPTDVDVCQGDDGTFTVVASGTGLTYQWGWSIDDVNIDGNAGEPGHNTASITVSNATVYFACVITDANGCSVTSNFAKLNEITPSVGGTISTSSNEVCTSTSNFPAGFFTLSGHTGDVVQWEYSTDNSNWTNWNGGGSTSSPAGSMNTSGTFYVRALVQNGVCSSVYSSTASVTVSTSPGDPNVFGCNEWNVYAYNGNSLDLTGTTYQGYYTEPNLCFNTTNRWASNGAPSDASGYQGCTVNPDNHTFVYKRTCFECGYYTLDVGGDDDIRVYVDGVQVHQQGCCSNSTGVWSGFLDNTSTVEIRLGEAAGGSYLSACLREILPPTTTTCCTANTEFGTLTGSANVNNGYIQLTPNAGGQYGDAFSTNTANLSQDFNIVSKIYLGDDDNGADGLRFTFRKNTNDIMFDFDTYQNGAELANDHFTLFTTANGQISSDFDLNNIEDGVWHDMIVDWNATTQAITVTFDGNVIYTTTRDIVNLDLGGDPIVNFGFQAWTGGAYNEQAACVSSVTYNPCVVSTAPILSNTSVSNTCPTTTVDLNSLVTSATPSGATLVWFTNDTHTGTVYANPTTANEGTYYAFYYDATNDCYSAASAAVTVTINCCANDEFSLTGDASLQNGYIQLTPDAQAQSGQAWSNVAVYLNQDFNQVFKVYAGNKDAGGADGFAFVLKGNSPLLVGGGGGGLGYGGISPSLAFEFDTYHNFPNGDLVTDHFAVHTGGNSGASGRLGANIDLGNIEDDTWHDFIIDWDYSAQTLTVTFNGSVIYTLTRDIVNLDFGGNPLVNFGFTASTGADYNEQAVCVHEVTYVPCKAGAVSPILSSNTGCTNSTFDLNSLVTSNTPSGATLVWFTNSSHTGTPYSTPNAAITGNTYYAFYYDATNDCYSPASVPVTIKAGLNITNITDTHPNCGQGNGSITISFNDNPNRTHIEFSLDGGTTYQTAVPDNSGSVTYFNLSDGTYNIFARWQGGECEAHIGIRTLISTSGPSVTASADQTICVGESVNLTANATGGAGTKTYQWNDNTGTPVGTGASISLSPTITTTYSVIATDQNGCTDIDMVTVTVRDLPTATLSKIDPTSGFNNGSITITFPNHSMETHLQFSLNGGSSYQPIVLDNTNSITYSNLASGSYTIYARWGDGGCPVLIGSINLINSGAPVVDIPDATICNGASVTLSTTASAGMPPYSFSWSHGLGSGTSKTVSPTVTTTYTVTVTDANGASSTDQAIVTVIPLPSTTISKTDATCSQSNGQITFAFADEPSKSSIQFSLDGGTTYQTAVPDNSNSVTYTGLAAGTYTLFAKWGDDSCPTSLGNITLNDVVNPVFCNPSLTFQKSAVDNVQVGTMFRYTFTFVNNTGVILNNVTFRDTLFNGVLFITDARNTTNGIQVIGVPVRDSIAHLTINNIPIGTSSFEIYVHAPLNYSGSNPFCNQAYLSGLTANNPNLSDIKMSDNPNTGTANDATCTYIWRPEICDNGIDDDLDGDIDCEDSDCKNVGTANQIHAGN